MRQQPHPNLTTWHITWGTYGTRLHGGARPTVERKHNQPGQPFVPRDLKREQTARERMRFSPLYLTREQCLFAQDAIPTICDRGGWSLRICSASSDHVHVLLDIKPEIHGEKVRRLLKRWLGESLSKSWPLPDGATWWAQQGSNLAIHDADYLNNAYGYIRDQRMV